MNTTVKILQRKIENSTPELLEALTKVIDQFENQSKSSVPQFQVDEVLYRIQFHKDNPKTKLDFYENISDLKKYFA
ncbi:hypothetical protein [Chryseobacterium sp.]|uniref:hypothetical protein n=1 Tax=Chryseobacterium sp. TaxID=1871047 RepID=UPI0025BACFF5|nr:hypothetical protein [Chryseobacterium sp.]